MDATPSPSAIHCRSTFAAFPSLPLRLAAALIGLGAVLALAGSGKMLARTAPLVAEIERWAELAGLGLQQASVTGYRFTSDLDIFDAIDLAHAHTLLSFDSRSVKARIEELPWVDTASIERILPDRIEVHITERTPFAVWRRGERCFLIDRSGRVLARVPTDGFPTLPHVAGEGGADAAAALIGLLAVHPALMGKVALAERIGERRWTLRLAGGGTIELPADGAAEALAGAIAIDHALGGGARRIDVRIPGRTLVRAAPMPPQGAALVASGM